VPNHCRHTSLEVSFRDYIYGMACPGVVVEALHCHYPPRQQSRDFCLMDRLQGRNCRIVQRHAWRVGGHSAVGHTAYLAGGASACSIHNRGCMPSLGLHTRPQTREWRGHRHRSTSLTVRKRSRRGPETRRRAKLYGSPADGQPVRLFGQGWPQPESKRNRTGARRHRQAKATKRARPAIAIGALRRRTKWEEPTNGDPIDGRRGEVRSRSVEDKADLANVEEQAARHIAGPASRASHA